MHVHLMVHWFNLVAAVWVLQLAPLGGGGGGPAGAASNGGGAVGGAQISQQDHEKVLWAISCVANVDSCFMQNAHPGFFLRGGGPSYKEIKGGFLNIFYERTNIFG